MFYAACDATGPLPTVRADTYKRIVLALIQAKADVSIADEDGHQPIWFRFGANLEPLQSLERL